MKGLVLLRGCLVLFPGCLALVLVSSCGVDGAERSEAAGRPGASVLRCGDLLEFPKERYGTEVGRVMPQRGLSYDFVADSDHTTFALSDSNVSITVTDANGLVGRNGDQGIMDPSRTYYMTFGVPTVPGRTYHVDLYVYRVESVSGPPTSLQVRCCDDVTTPGGTGPGTDFRACGDCGWQFCLPSGAWSTECEPRPGATCAGGGTCGGEGVCSSPDVVPPGDDADVDQTPEEPPDQDDPGFAEEEPEECLAVFGCDGVCDECLSDDPDCCWDGACDGVCGCNEEDPDCCSEDAYYEEC